MLIADANGSGLPWHEVITWMFLIANGGRIVAYLPQIMAAWRCPAGAKSVSVLTWSYFAFAHLTALLYALFVLHDSRSVWIFSANLGVTLCLVGLLLYKRLRYRQLVRIMNQAGNVTRMPVSGQVLSVHSLFHTQAENAALSPAAPTAHVLKSGRRVVEA
jgi:uncharacterized membrane protein